MELLILACLVREPSQCESFHIPFQGPMDLKSCVFRAHLLLGTWIEEHPTWAVRSWRCGAPQA